MGKTEVVAVLWGRSLVHEAELGDVDGSGAALQGLLEPGRLGPWIGTESARRPPVEPLAVGGIGARHDGVPIGVEANNKVCGPNLDHEPVEDLLDGRTEVHRVLLVARKAAAYVLDRREQARVLATLHHLVVEALGELGRMAQEVVANDVFRKALGHEGIHEPGETEERQDHDGENGQQPLGGDPPDHASDCRPRRTESAQDVSDPAFGAPRLLLCRPPRPP